MVNSYFINKYANELKRVENQLKFQPHVNNPDQMSVGHLMLLEEQKRLRGRIERESRAGGVRNPLLSDNNDYGTNHYMQSARNNFSIEHGQQPDNRTRFNPIHLANLEAFKNLNEVPEAENDRDQVSPEERRRACEALKPNGCGPKSNAALSFVIPDNVAGFDFTQACNNHDRKFATLNYGFNRANREFLAEMLAVPPKRVTSSFTGKSTLEKPDKLARYYHSWVIGEEGLKNYKKAQRNAYICKFGRNPN